MAGAGVSCLGDWKILPALSGQSQVGLASDSENCLRKNMLRNTDFVQYWNSH